MTAVQTAPDATRTGATRTRWHENARLRQALPLLIALLAVVLRAVNLSRAYDLFIDEPFYLDVGRSVADGGLPFARGEYFFLHPPGFFLVEAAWMKVFGTSGDLFDQIFRLRYLNVLFSGANVLLLWTVARRLGGLRAAVVAALIYAMDPWIIRQNSFVLLETATLTWVLVGYLLLLKARDAGPQRIQWLIGAGLAFGVGVLTKEFAVLVTLLPLALMAWRRWEVSRREAGLLGALTCVPFAVWMLVVFASGHGGDFSSEVSAGFNRVSGAEQVTGFNSPDAPSFTSTLLGNGVQFWTTYLVLGLGSVAALLLYRSKRPEHQVLVAFVAGAVPMLAYGVVAGANEEQFFNFLWVPAILAVAVWSADRRAKLHAKRWLVLPLVALAVVSYLGNWGVTHFTRSDGTRQVDTWMTAHVPAGSVIGVTNSVQREIFTRYRMVDDRSATSLQGSGARYLVVFQQQVDQGYGFLSSTDLDRQVAGLTPVYSHSTRSNGSVEVYALR